MDLLNKNNLPLLIVISLICNTVFTFFMMKFYHELNNDKRKQNFYNLIKNSEEYENKTINQDFIKFVARKSQVPINDKEVEDLYFKIHGDEKIELKRNPRVRKYVYILVILWLVSNVLLVVSLLGDKKIENKFKYIFFGVQSVFIYLLIQVYTYVYGKNKDFDLDDKRKNSIGYLIIFVWLAFILLLFKFLGVLDKNFIKNISKDVNNILNTDQDKQQQEQREREKQKQLQEQREREKQLQEQREREKQLQEQKEREKQLKEQKEKEKKLKEQKEKEKKKKEKQRKDKKKQKQQQKQEQKQQQQQQEQQQQQQQQQQQEQQQKQQQQQQQINISKIKGNNIDKLLNDNEKFLNNVSTEINKKKN